jgi:raffinose/stachyose/melibiose transport system permease protein
VYKVKNFIIKFIKYLILTIVAVLQLYPLFWLFIFSLKNNAEIFGGNPMGLPEVFRWENYAYVFQNANIGLYLRNSAVVTFASIAISTVLATMASYAIARMKWRLSNAALITFLSGMMIPLHAVLVPLLVLLTRTQLTNTFWALILPYTAFALPMAIYIFVGFFGTLPRELEEAACIDGLNIYGIFLKIMLPLIRPAIATVSVFTYLACWNELMFAVSFTGGDQMATITIGVMNMAGRYAANWGRIGAGLAVATAPTLLIYVVLSKQIQKSFTTGALKG